MNKATIIAVAAIIIVVMAIIYLTQQIQPTPQILSAEEEAYSAIEKEIESAITNMTEEEIENALLSQ
jgi:uncharacterized protein YoxC